MTYIIRIQAQHQVELTHYDVIALRNLNTLQKGTYVSARFGIVGEQMHGLVDTLNESHYLYAGIVRYTAYGEDSGKEYALTEADQMALNFMLNSYVCAHGNYAQMPSKGNKVAAIKWFRVAFGCGLKEAKDAVDQYQKDMEEKKSF